MRRNSYTCPHHLDMGGYDARRGCGGWAPGGRNDGRLCTEAEEADYVRRMRGTTNDLVALMNYVDQLAATRRELIRTLIDEYGWSQHDVADELGVSQPRISTILKEKPGRRKRMNGHGQQRQGPEEEGEGAGRQDQAGAESGT